jgi:4-hydroxyphenylpyruvate dioxygenase
MPEPLPIKRIHHVELVVGNAKQAAYYYRRALGFEQIGYCGPETGRRGRASYALRQGRIVLVLTTPLIHLDPLNVFLTLHGDSVKDICFQVEDADQVYRTAVERGATGWEEPHDLHDRNGRARRASIRAYGDTLHSFLDLQDYGGPFLPGFNGETRPGLDLGLVRVDHLVGNVEDRQMERWVEWYNRVFGFEQFVHYDDKDISTEFSALRSTVMASPHRHIKLPINEPAPGRKKSQIQEFIDFHVTAGVQHVALYTGDILSTVHDLRENGVEFLKVPARYYEGLWDRVGEIREDRERVRDLQILVDRDDKGYLLQIFTKPLHDRPTLFLEVIQRRGSDSFGKGNFKALFEAIEQEQALRGNL